MSDQLSLSNIDSLLFQLGLQTRELFQKKNELKQQIKVCRADIAERRSYIQSVHRDIKKLEEEARMKQSTVVHNKANAKSMKATNSVLLQYEQMLKAELKSRKASYNHDMEVYEGRITSYRKIFQSHKEYYYKNPLAQTLLGLQAEKEAINSRIKVYDEQITMKQNELDHLTGPAANSSTEKLSENASDQQLITEDKPLDPQVEEDSGSSIDISSFHLNQAKNGHKVSVEVNTGDIHEENKVQDTGYYPEEASNRLWPCEKLDEQREPVEIHSSDQDKETEIVMEQQSAASEEPVEDRVAVDEAQAPSKGDNEAFAALPQSSSQETYQSSPAKMTSSAQTFPFNFSPASSPHQGSSDVKSPAFLFSLPSDSGTTAFSGFGFNTGSSQDEDSSFTFPSSFFNEKKTAESKSSSCPGFLFDQSEQSEDFQFAFTSKSPTATNKDNTRDEFPFSFNF